MGNFKSFEESACWKEARILRDFLKEGIISEIPNHERYDLISQIRRSSRSVGNNIAEEGFRNFCHRGHVVDKIKVTLSI